MSASSAEAWLVRAHDSAHNGDVEATRSLLSDALKEHPDNARLWHGAGNVLLKLGLADEAAEHFGRAHALSPGNLDAAVDQAIALSQAERYNAAISVLTAVEPQGAGLAHYCSTRANAERGAGHAAEAAEWYDRALAIEPARPKALLGRASVALERGEPTAVQRFDKVLQVDPGNPYVWLGKAQAHDVEGDSAGARNIMEQVAAQAPGYTDGLRFLAQLRLAAGEADFASHYADAVAKAPKDPNIRDSWGKVLAGLDYNAEAAEVMGKARTDFPEIEQFAFLEAVYAGAGGDDDRAEELFASLDEKPLDRLVHEARHRIRRSEYERAAQLLEEAIAIDAADIGAWALLGIVWRLTGDERADWLHAQAGLHGPRDLHDAETVLPPAIAMLHRLHDGSPLPLGQSLRGGTQTRGRLFDRTEPEFAALKAAIESTVEAYREALPAEDCAHPLLMHRHAPWRMAGSWSVRLSGGGDYHTSHIHPQGIVSSALYLELPDATPDDDEHAGWLELGRPPPDLRLDLPPLAMIQPRVGQLALFPSTLYHGTRAFSHGRRMTVAFDVSLADRA